MVAVSDALSEGFEDELWSALCPSTYQVMEFHKAFGHPIADKPNIANINLNALRVGLLMEEVEELAMALLDRDQVEVLDALCDIQYVLDGAKLSLGYAAVFDRAFEEVQRSNMSKLGEDGKPIYNEVGKVMKGPNYSEPNLKPFIEELNKV